MILLFLFPIQQPGGQGITFDHMSENGYAPLSVQEVDIKEGNRLLLENALCQSMILDGSDAPDCVPQVALTVVQAGRVRQGEEISQQILSTSAHGRRDFVAGRLQHYVLTSLCQVKRRA